MGFAFFLRFGDAAVVGFVFEGFAFLWLVDAEVALVEVEPSGSEGVVLEVENPFGVEGLVHEAAFEVEVRAGGVAGAAAEADYLAGFDVLSELDVYLGEVSV